MCGIHTKTEENSQGRSELQRAACWDFIKDLHARTIYPITDKNIDQRISMEEKKIIAALSEFVISDKAIEIVRKTVAQIQGLLLETFPPESQEFQYLKEVFPQLLNFRPN